VRNSSLVKWARAKNPTGLKHDTEAADFHPVRWVEVVGEHCCSVEAGLRRPVERQQELMRT